MIRLLRPKRRTVHSFNEIPWMATFIDRFGIEWRKTHTNGARTDADALVPHGHNVFAAGPYVITDEAKRFNKL